MIFSDIMNSLGIEKINSAFYFIKKSEHSQACTFQALIVPFSFNFYQVVINLEIIFTISTR